ncbi:MAG: glycosyltransferase family 87 protein [Phycisphaerales bacterium]
MTTTGVLTPKLSEDTPRHWIFAPFGQWFVEIGWWLWAIFAAVIAIRTGLHPEKNSVSECYRIACACWWSGRSMYENVYEDKFNDIYNGFIYLPHAAIVYSPFYILPPWLGESLNRVAVIAMMAWAVWRVTKMASTRSWNDSFFVVSAITIGVGAGNAVNGQYNLPVAASLVLAACALVEKRWWWGAIWLAVAVLFKPIAIAPVLLAIALYPALWWRFPVVALVAFAMPFVTCVYGPAYAWGEYEMFWTKVVRATQPLPRRFAEFSTVLWWFVSDLTNFQRNICRAVAAVVTLGLGFVALRRHGELRGGLILWALGVSYIVIFNPRTEGLTYVVVAPAIALFGAMEFAAARTPIWRRAAGITLLAMGFLMIFVHELMPRSGAYFEVAQGSKDLLARPIMSMLFYLWLTWLTLVDRREAAPVPILFNPTVQSSP